MKPWLFFVFFSTLAVAETTSFSSNISVGDDGLNVSVPGFGPNIKINNDGNGVYSSTFSLTGSPAVGGVAARADSPTRIIRVSPAASAPSQLTDTDTFFKGVGKPDPVEESSRRGSSRRR